MTASDITLVQASFRLIIPIADDAGALFYARLFELDPALRALVCGDRQEQGSRLMSTLTRTIQALRRLDLLIPVVRVRAARHDVVFADHYASVGAALIWTLQKALGPAFSINVENAWTRLYSFLANTMIEAQRNARAAA